MDFLPYKNRNSVKDILVMSELQDVISKHKFCSAVTKTAAMKFVECETEKFHNDVASDMNEIAQLKKQIEELERKIKITKQKCIDDVKRDIDYIDKTYASMIEHAKRAYTNKEEFVFRIFSLTVPNKYVEPSVEKWKQNNPILYETIDYLLEDMIKKGYSPSVNISEWYITYPEGCKSISESRTLDSEISKSEIYEGGRELIIKCRFD